MPETVPAVDKRNLKGNGQRAADVSTADTAKSGGSPDKFDPSTDSAEIAKRIEGIDEIVVTGTSIRGVIPESSPLEIYDAVDIRNMGALTVEQFIRKLTKNNNTLTEIGTGASSRETTTDSVNAVDIRGLGVGTTLVLLNGRRMAPSSAGRTADISLIPIGAVERVEILTDGASAIYGADAIGGVVNFVLKDRQEGVESVISFGAADGGRDQLRIDQSFGFNWAEGSALVALSYMDQNALDASDRGFSQAAAPRALIAEDSRRTALVTIGQRFPADFGVDADLLYSARSPHPNGLTISGELVDTVHDDRQIVSNFAITRALRKALEAELLATYADNSTKRELFVTESGTRSAPLISEDDTEIVDITAKLSGELAKFRGGAVMFSLGVGYMEEEWSRLVDSTQRSPGSTPTLTAQARDTKYAFTEVLVPVISPDHEIPGIRRLELNFAARHTDFSDFGEDTSPKLGVLWSPVTSLKIRGTFGESFKAPFLFQLSPIGATNALFPPSALGFPDIWSPDGSSTMLFVQGFGNPKLQPEEAQSYTFGFDFDLTNLSISATYFNIDYTDRIDTPDPSGGFIAVTRPQDFPTFFDLNPTLEEVTSILEISDNFLNLTGIAIDDPAAVHQATTVLFDNRLRNLAIVETDGFDLRIDYVTRALGGELGVGISATKTFDLEQRVFEGSMPFSLLDTVLFPVDLRAQAYLGLQKNRWNARLNVNYVDNYDNPFDPENPSIEDWTTVDLIFSYEIGGADGPLDGVAFTLTIQNAFDRDPPFVPVQTTPNTTIVFPIGFDPANANPLGRFVNVRLSKQW